MNDGAIRGLLIGESPTMRQLRAQIVSVGPSRLPVLIQGPTGSGKELVARALHIASKRRGRFVPFNVAAISESLFESTVFGHVKGAFSGAVGSIPGYLAEANAGTCFMDEVGSLPLDVQCKLLRALDNGEFRPVGAHADQHSDFRLVAATNESIRRLVDGARFRRDLAFRLGGLVIDVPPLSERSEDVPLLVEHFTAQCMTAYDVAIRFSAAAMRVLQNQAWRGNVRELKFVVERAALLAGVPVIDAETLRSVLDNVSTDDENAQMTGDDREALRRALEAAHWNQTHAARQLAIHPITVWRRMKRLGIRPPSNGRHPHTDLDSRGGLP
jgi:DNA-binding NtrC family response regulator